MKHTVWMLALVLALLLSVGATPVARASAPVGGCLPGWHLHQLGDHHEGQPRHVGNSFDQNGDGYVCVEHVTPDGNVHVHMDNVVPN